jgi:hypothetical protein
MAKKDLGVDELRRLIRDLEKLPDEMRVELRREMRAAGQQALTKARENASWSSRIPAATRLQISFAKRRPGVALVVDKNRAPHGRALEHLGAPGTFRHPLFGNRKKWVRQKAKPFVFPAAREVFERMDADIAAAVDRAARKHGFK